jgi:3-oxoacyl-[acyl-carrier protein] reductase
MRFKNKVVIVTGAGKGIGREIAIDFAKEGAKVVLASRTIKDLEEVYRGIIKTGSESLIVHTDVSKEDDVINLFKKTIEQYGNVDILVNNAAISLVGKESNRITSLSLKEWQYHLDVNLTGTFLCMREALRIMVKNNYGKIIVISSEAGKKGCSLKSAYCSTKFGQIGLTESASADIKSKNININTVCPAGVDTPLTRMNYPNLDYGKAGFMQSSDISRVVLFLASEEASAIKGASIDVYGGHLQNIDSNDTQMEE